MSEEDFLVFFNKGILSDILDKNNPDLYNKIMIINQYISQDYNLTTLRSKNILTMGYIDSFYQILTTHGFRNDDRLLEQTTLTLANLNAGCDEIQAGILNYCDMLSVLSNLLQ